ncbi:MAG: type II toxin-antitoxin system HicA family toxin [Elusimicrobia bacterium]|nr:type II toxin-antitoxin system HicA family toxin [Elusimicrobiota bacterium]
MPVTSKDLVRFLKRKGWIERRQKGSHLIMTHEEAQRHLSIPMHQRDLHKGLLLRILKLAGHALEDLR